MSYFDNMKHFHIQILLLHWKESRTANFQAVFKNEMTDANVLPEQPCKFDNRKGLRFCEINCNTRMYAM